MSDLDLDVLADPATRPSWDAWARNIVRAIATRGDCVRSRVGALILDTDHRIVSAGYNGAPSGQPGCWTAGACPRGDIAAESYSSYENCIAIHAEANAILYAGRARCVGATIFITREPCHECIRLIQAAGISRVVVVL